MKWIRLWHDKTASKHELIIANDFTQSVNRKRDKNSTSDAHFMLLCLANDIFLSLIYANIYIDLTKRDVLTTKFFVHGNFHKVLSIIEKYLLYMSKEFSKKFQQATKKLYFNWNEMHGKKSRKFKRFFYWSSNKLTKAQWK